MKCLHAYFAAPQPEQQPGHSGYGSHGSSEESIESVSAVAKELASDVIYDFAKIKTCSPCNEHAKTLRRTVSEVSTRHEILFSSMVKRLSLTDDTICKSFSNVMNEMFVDKQYNWGRVVTIYAFAAWLAQHCRTHGMKSNVNDIVECAGSYIADNLCEWILKNGGWVG